MATHTSNIEHRTSNDADLEEITREALAAAQAGRWNLVEACYVKRAERLPSSALSPECAARLRQMDGVIVERVLVAKAAVGLMMGEAEKGRRRLAELQRRIGGHSAMTAGDWISRIA
jgi:hypothetical protein